MNGRVARRLRKAVTNMTGAPVAQTEYTVIDRGVRTYVTPPHLIPKLGETFTMPVHQRLGTKTVRFYRYMKKNYRPEMSHGIIH